MCLTAEAFLGIAQQGIAFLSAKEQADQQNQNYKNNAVTAYSAANDQYASTNNKIIQEEAKAAQDRLQNKIQTLKALGTAKASTQNQGESTNSVMHDIQRQGAQTDGTTNVNLKNAKTEALATRQSIQQQTQNRINSVDPGQQPSLIAHAISGLGTVYASSESKYKETDHNGGSKTHG